MSPLHVQFLVLIFAGWVNRSQQDVIGSFSTFLRSAGIETVKLPARSPNLNAYAERFVRSIKSECLAKTIPLVERHLRNTVAEYIEHYHTGRNHQGLDNQLILKSRTGIPVKGKVACRERLGGLLHYYYRRAA